MKLVWLYIMLAVGLAGLHSCKTQMISVNHLPDNEKQAWDSLYINWMSNGMGTCTPMMEEELEKGQCTKHKMDLKIFIGPDGTIKRIDVLNKEIICTDAVISKSLETCMLETLQTDFIFPTSMGGKILEARVGGDGFVK